MEKQQMKRKWGTCQNLLFDLSLILLPEYVLNT